MDTCLSGLWFQPVWNTLANRKSPKQRWKFQKICQTTTQVRNNIRTLWRKPKKRKKNPWISSTLNMNHIKRHMLILVYPFQPNLKRNINTYTYRKVNMKPKNHLIEWQIIWTMHLHDSGFKMYHFQGVFGPERKHHLTNKPPHEPRKKKPLYWFFKTGSFIMA